MANTKTKVERTGRAKKTTKPKRTNDFARLDFEDMRGGYTALGYKSVRVANKEGLTFSGGSGDRHVKYDRVRLINQSRTFMRDNAIYKGVIERAIRYIVGNGFTLHSKAKKSDFIAELWKDFWRKPEIRMMQSGKKFEKMIMREIFVAGDTAVVRLIRVYYRQSNPSRLTGQIPERME